MKLKLMTNETGHHIHFVCNSEAYAKLVHLTKTTGLSKTRILNNLLLDKTEPLISYSELNKIYKEIGKIGTNINQISRKFNQTGYLDMKGLSKKLDNFNDIYSSLFSLISSANLGKGIETEDWREQIYKIIVKSKNPVDFLGKFWQNSYLFFKRED